MRYYCSECKSELIICEHRNNQETYCYCPVCHSGLLVKLPDFETPAQYEKRTGKKWNGAVWYRYRYVDDGVNGGSNWYGWHLNTAKEARKSPYDSKFKKMEIQRICAASPEPPPDDWQPEEV